METSERIEADSWVDQYVAVTEGEEQYSEAVGERPQDNGLDGQSGNGTPLEAGDGHDGPPPQGAAGADAHFKQATGNGHVTASSGPPTGSIQGFVEASTMESVQNPVPEVASPTQPLSVSGAYVHAPPIAMMPGVWNRLPYLSELYALPRMLYSRMGYSPASAGRMMPAPITATARTTVMTTVTPSVAVSAAQTGLVYTSLTSPRAPISEAYAICPGYGAADHQNHIRSTFVDPRESGYMAILMPDKPKSEPLVEFLMESLGTQDLVGSPGGEAGAVLRYEQATGGGYGARPREARTTGYYGYSSVPADVVHVDQAMVSGRVDWTSQTSAASYREPGGQVGQTVPDGRHAGADTARVAGSNVNTASRTPSVWAGVERAMLYTGVGPSYMDASAAGILQPVYLGQPTQLRPAAPIQLANGQFYQPLVFDPGAGTAPAPNWNHPVESWVRAPQGQPMAVPPNTSASGWEAGFILEARGTRPPIGQPGANQLDQSTITSESRPPATSTPAAGRGSRQMLKLQRYNGTDGLETFLCKFHSMS